MRGIFSLFQLLFKSMLDVVPFSSGAKMKELLKPIEVAKIEYLPDLGIYEAILPDNKGKITFSNIDDTFKRYNFEYAVKNNTLYVHDKKFDYCQPVYRLFVIDQVDNAYSIDDFALALYTRLKALGKLSDDSNNKFLCAKFLEHTDPIRLEVILSNSTYNVYLDSSSIDREIYVTNLSGKRLKLGEVKLKDAYIGKNNVLHLVIEFCYRGYCEQFDVPVLHDHVAKIEQYATVYIDDKPVQQDYLVLDLLR
jgi:hypothetical protein